MKLKRLPWSGKGADPNRVRERKILRSSAKRASASTRWVIDYRNATGKKDGFRYDASEGAYTVDPGEVTFFLYREHAQAVADVLGEHASVGRCSTRLVKGRRVVAR